MNSEYAARRRALIRMHHPDVGGDPYVLGEELLRLDREFARDHKFARDHNFAESGHPRTSSTASAPAVRVVVRPTSRARRMRRRTARRINEFRGRLPRAVPGSRRYFDI